MAWLAWASDGFPQRGLVEMIQEGLLEIPDHDPETVSFSLLANDLRSLRIGFGRERYRPALIEQIEALRLRQAGAGKERDEDGEGLPGSSQLEKRLNTNRLLRGLVDTLLEMAPLPGDAPALVLECARRFIKERTRRTSQLDNYAADKLVKDIEDMLAALGTDEEPGSLDAWAWLADLPRAASVGGQGARRAHARGPRAGRRPQRALAHLRGRARRRPFPRHGLAGPDRA